MRRSFRWTQATMLICCALFVALAIHDNDKLLTATVAAMTLAVVLRVESTLRKMGTKSESALPDGNALHE